MTLGWAAAAYAKSDPAYAAELWLAWERACAPMGLEPSPPDQLASVLWIGCARAGECPDWLVEPYTTLPVNGTPGRPSELLSGYAVLRQPQLSTEPYFLMSTTTQRQTEGHEHPDRGSFSLYHQGTPIVLDPVSRHDIAGIWVAFFSRWQRYRC